MATLYRVCDGPRGQAHDDPRLITYEEIDRLHEENKLDYHGETGPIFNPDAPSSFPKHAVLKIENGDVDKCKLAKRGFYNVDLSPEDSDKYPSEAEHI